VDRGGKRAAFVADRESLGEQVAEAVKEGDRIVVMGARDDSLTDFGHSLLARIEANS
jgi:UDP-N-acetylmuramate--alanine ligase